LRAIGQALSATHLLEGSVRKEGARVRITAQLIQAENGVHVWTESYDRELTGVFAVQEDIATAIAGALRMPLGLKPGERLVSDRTNDLDSYQQFLRARALVRARGTIQGLKPLADAAASLEQVVARDPAYAPAWALLALAYDYTPQYDPSRNSGAVEEERRVVNASLAKAEAAAQRAIQLDANLANGYVALALAQHARGRLLLAEELYSKALALDGNNPDALQPYSILLNNVGRLKESLAMRQQLQTLEPFVPVFNAATAVVL
jgi:tetratricopeptide (TPR) repeat protein